MKLITPLLLLALAVPLSASWWNPFTWFRTEPPCVVDGVLQPRNDATYRGPVCDKGEWNIPAILEADVTTQQLANIKDQEEFWEERQKHAFPPTKAVYINFIALPRETPVDPRLLTSQAQLDRARVHLRDAAASLGMPCQMGLYEHTRGLFGGTVDYRGDARRYWYAETEAHPRTGGILIAQVTLMFASNPVEAARKYLAADVRLICTAPANRPARRPISE